MTLKKYFYALISVLLISAPISAQQKADQMTKRAKYYVFQQKDKIGKMLYENYVKIKTDSFADGF